MSESLFSGMKNAAKLKGIISPISQKESKIELSAEYVRARVYKCI